MEPGSYQPTHNLQSAPLEQGRLMRKRLRRRRASSGHSLYLIGGRLFSDGCSVSARLLNGDLCLFQGKTIRPRLSENSDGNIMNLSWQEQPDEWIHRGRRPSSSHVVS